MPIAAVWGLLSAFPGMQAFLQLAPFLRAKVFCVVMLMITE